MLNPTLVLNYINSYVLTRFSTYLPDKKRIGMDLSDEKYKTDIENEFYIFDPDNRQIIGIVEAIPDMSSNIITGHPILGVMSFNELPEFMLNVEKSRNASKWGMIDPLFEFIPPNILRTNPIYRGKLTLIYERVHSDKYTTIPIWAESLFLDYCLGHIQVLLGNKRKKFQTIQTPYGEVPLNADEVKSDGKELIDKIEEKLQTYNPSIIIDIG